MRRLTALNEVDWTDLGFVCDGRFLFSQRSLENAPAARGLLAIPAAQFAGSGLV